MIEWQVLLLLFFAVINAALFIAALVEVKQRANCFGLTKWLLGIGAFVWGDVLVLAPFWFLVSLLAIWLRDWNLFFVVVSVFWTVRSWGEVMYWLNEQFAHTHRNQPRDLMLHSIFQGEAIWFIYQLTWQCGLVISIIASLYFGRLWLDARF